LSKMPEGEGFEKAKNDMRAWVGEELADVGREYELFLHEHVANTRAARMAATAPSHAQWAAIIRQQNSLNRQLERKIRLLMELQRERKSEAQLMEDLEASSPQDPSDPQEGGPGLRQPAARASHGAPPSACGRAGASPCRFRGAHTSRQKPSGRRCHPCLASEGRGFSPAAAGSADPRSWGPRFFHGATDKPRTPTPGVRATQLRALLILIGAVLAAAFKKIKNRGNELKDLLQRQGITEIATSKRTLFCIQKAVIGLLLDMKILHAIPLLDKEGPGAVDRQAIPTPPPSEEGSFWVGQALPLRLFKAKESPCRRRAVAFGSGPSYVFVGTAR